MTANHPEDLVARLQPVAWRVKRYGEIAGGVTAWSEWMLFQNTNLAGRWADPGNVVCEPLYSVDAVTSLVGERDALADRAELAELDLSDQKLAANDAVAWWKEAVARAELAESTIRNRDETIAALRDALEPFAYVAGNIPAEKHDKDVARVVMDEFLTAEEFANFRARGAPVRDHHVELVLSVDGLRVMHFRLAARALASPHQEGSGT